MKGFQIDTFGKILAMLPGLAVWMLMFGYSMSEENTLHWKLHDGLIGNTLIRYVPLERPIDPY